MVDSLGWVNAVAGAPEYTGRMLRQLNAVGFAGATAARPLGARSGVRPGTSATTVTASSTVWTCQAFAGLLDGQVAGEAGPYPFAFDAVATGPMTAADGSNPRIDIIYVDVDDPSEDASAVPAVTRKYLAGVAAASPVAPSAPAGCMTVAQINVPKSGGGAPTVTWVAPYVAAAGGTVPFNTKPEMEAWVTAPKGQRAYVLASGLEYASDGAGAWPPVGGVALVSSQSFSGAAVVSVDGLSGYDRYEFVLDVTATSAANNLSIRLRSGGADNSAAQYDSQRFVKVATSGTAASFEAQTSWASLAVGSRALHVLEGKLIGLNSARQTWLDMKAMSGDAAANFGTIEWEGRHRAATAFNGFSFLFSAGTGTGTLRVYGYNNG